MPLSIRRALILLLLAALCAQAAPRVQSREGQKAGGYVLTRADVEFLEDLSHRAFLYFLEHADPGTGLVLDRARASGEAHPAGHPSHGIASSAATGFGLTALEAMPCEGCPAG